MQYRRSTPRYRRFLLLFLSGCLAGILIHQRWRDPGPERRPGTRQAYGGFVHRFAPPTRGAPPSVEREGGEPVFLDAAAFRSTLRAGRRIAFDLGGDLLHGVVEQVDAQGPVRSWTGSLESTPGEFAFMSMDGAISGRIDLYQGRRFFVEVGPDGHRLHEVRPESARQCGLRLLESVASPSGRPAGEPADSPRAGQAVVEVSVGVFWTRSARLGANGGREAGSAAAIRRLLNQAAFSANEAFWTATAPARSPFRVVLRIHPAGELAYRESGNDRTDLERLTGTSDGYLDEVHAIRRQRRYDIVILVVEELNSGGRAWMMTSADGREFADKAFGVVERASASAMYNLAHEIAHIFGAGHGTPAPGLYPFSAGWHFRLGSFPFHTIMAYRARPDERPYPSFSDPARTIAPELPDATPVSLGEPGSADNALTIQLTAPIIARFM